jgi:hypothetical protein
MTDREIMRQALDALELLARCEHPLTKIQVRKPRDGGSIVTVYPHQVATDAAEPLRERLAQPLRTHWEGCEEVHPECRKPRREWVACKTLCELCVKRGYTFCANAVKTTPINTPPQRKPLTDEEVLHLWAGDTPRPVLGKNKVLAFARAIEAAHGIGEKK